MNNQTIAKRADDDRPDWRDERHRLDDGPHDARRADDDGPDAHHIRRGADAGHDPLALTKTRRRLTPMRRRRCRVSRSASSMSRTAAAAPASQPVLGRRRWHGGGQLPGLRACREFWAPNSNARVDGDAAVGKCEHRFEIQCDALDQHLAGIDRVAPGLDDRFARRSSDCSVARSVWPCDTPRLRSGSRRASPRSADRTSAAKLIFVAGNYRSRADVGAASNLSRISANAASADVRTSVARHHWQIASITTSWT